MVNFLIKSREAGLVINNSAGLQCGSLIYDEGVTSTEMHSEEK